MTAEHLRALIAQSDDQTLMLVRSECENLLLARHANGYETLPAITAEWEDFNLKEIERYLTTRAARAIQSGATLIDLARTERLVTETSAGLVPTIAGWLAYNDVPQSLNASWGVTCLVFRGREFQRDALVARQDLTGSLAKLIDATVGFVSRYIRTFPVFEPGKIQRKDVLEYDLTAVREAVANAVAHRDYRANEPIQIRIYDDRMEIQSPGPLPSDLNLERVLAGGVTRPRNPIVAQILLSNGYMERAGFGIVFIRQQMEKLGAPSPEFENGMAHFLVRLWATPNPNLKE